MFNISIRELIGLRRTLIAFVFCSCTALFGQTKDTWTSFMNKDSTLLGYMDSLGIVKIEPKFSDIYSAHKFDHIIAVFDVKDDQPGGYYLTKTGKIVGRDSLYFFDNGTDCESEGFIRFRDNITDKVGVFNRNGQVVVPPIYNDLTPVRNGMLIVLEDAKKVLWEGGEHYSWVGGHEMLIDTNNNVLIADFGLSSELNFFSVEYSEIPPLDTIRESFLATDSNYISFVNFKKEFEQWLKKDLLVDLTIEKLLNFTIDSVVWESPTGWETSCKERLISQNFVILKEGLLELKNDTTDFFISIDGLNGFQFNSVAYEKYYNNCGDSKVWLYPMMSIVVSHRNGKIFSQNHYEFLRTDNGYRLLRVVVRDKELK